MVLIKIMFTTIFVLVLIKDKETIFFWDYEIL